MIIEVGDFFHIESGLEVVDPRLFSRPEPVFSTSFFGMIFLALHVEGDAVVAHIIHSPYETKALGKKTWLQLAYLEVDTLTKHFVEQATGLVDLPKVGRLDGSIEQSKQKYKHKPGQSEN